MLGRWAAGGGTGGEKSPEQEVEEERLRFVAVHRDSVLWFLGRRLEGVGEVQRGMMERRLEREVERGRSVLHKIKGSGGAGGFDLGEMNGYAPQEEGRGGAGGGSSGYKGGRGAAMDEEDRRQIEQQLSPEQLQLFARENQDMLKHYEDTLDQVRCVNAASS